eukprot:3346042-Pleurochrysis_carterae.AAC.1
MSMHELRVDALACLYGHEELCKRQREDGDGLRIALDGGVASKLKSEETTELVQKCEHSIWPWVYKSYHGGAAEHNTAEKRKRNSKKEQVEAAGKSQAK